MSDHPLLEETLMSCLALAALGGVVALFYWLVTGLSPWPGLVLGEGFGLATGLGVLTLASPRRWQ